MEKNLQIEYVNIEDLKEYKDNPRLNDLAVEPVVKSIEAFGFNNPILIDKDNNIVAGHTRLEAAKRLLIKEVPVIKLDLTEAQFKAFNIADNKTAQFADWDNMKLLILLQQLEKEDKDLLEATGFIEDELFSLMADKEISEAKEENFDEDSALEQAKKDCKVKKGQIWQLGRHRLLCGDATIKEDVMFLMDGKKADMVFTDPPWNVNYGGNLASGKDKDRKMINDNMSSDNFYKFLHKCFKNLHDSLNQGAMVYIVMSAQEWGNNMLALSKNNFHWSSTLIWKKSSLIISRKDYHTQYEPIWYGWKGDNRLCPLKDRTQSDVWEYKKPNNSDLHPTMKPLELIERAIINSSKPNAIILDVFGGSGSTLMAAEQSLRTCYMMEIDNLYCQVIIDRWESYTGEQAKCLNYEP